MQGTQGPPPPSPSASLLSSSYHIGPTQCAPPWTSLPKPSTHPACSPGVRCPQRRHLQAAAGNGSGQSKEAGVPGDLLHRAEVTDGYCVMLSSPGWLQRPKGSEGTCHLLSGRRGHHRPEKLTVATCMLPTAEAMARGLSGRLGVPERIWVDQLGAGTQEGYACVYVCVLRQGGPHGGDPAQ